MIPFEERVASSSQLVQSYDLDSNESSMKVFMSSVENRVKEWIKHCKTSVNLHVKSRLCSFSNVELLDDLGVGLSSIRQNSGVKIDIFFCEFIYLRIEGKNFMIKNENEEMKNRLSEAETYIEWIEE